jgi:hypothetical protein
VTIQLDNRSANVVNVLNEQISQLMAHEQRTGQNRQRAIEELVRQRSLVFDQCIRQQHANNTKPVANRARRKQVDIC